MSLCIIPLDKHCIQPPIKSTIMYHHLYMYWLDPMFWVLIPLFILLTLLWAWVCLHHMPTSSIYMSQTYNNKKIYRSSNEESTLIRGSLQSLYYCHHYSHDPMISIIHMMRSYPHTSGGNQFTLKSVHPSLHGLKHMRTSYYYHISLTFDLHNCISTKKFQNIIIYYGLHSLSLEKGKKPLKMVPKT